MTWSNDSCLPRQVADCARQANHFVFSEMTCPAPFAKIFLFSPDPNQLHIRHRVVPPEGRSRVVTSAGRDAVDARASGAQIAIAGRDEPRERSAGVQDDRRFYGEAVSFWHPLLVSSWRRRNQARPG